MAAGLGLGLVAILWLGSAAGEAWLGGKIQSALDDALVSGEARVGRVSTHGGSHFSLSHLSIVENGVTVVELSELDLQLRLWPLLLGRVVISQANIEAMALALRVEADGKVNLMRIFESEAPQDVPSEGLAWPLSIGALRVASVEVSLEAGTQTHRLEAAELSLGLRAKGHDWGVRDLELKGLLNQRPLHFDWGTAQFGSQVRVDALRVNWDTNRLLGALVERPSGLGLKIRESDVALGPFLDLAGLSEQAIGLELRGAFSGEVFQKEEGWSLDLKMEALGGHAHCVLKRENAVLSGAMGFEGLRAALLFPDLGEAADLSGVVVLEPSSLEHQVLRVILGPTRLKEHTIEGFAAELTVEGADIQVESARVLHAAGWAQMGGRVEKRGFRGEVQVGVHELSGLKEFGLDGLGGSAGLSGSLHGNWSGERVVEFNGEISGQNLSLPGSFVLGQVEGPVVFQLSGQTFKATGGFKGKKGEGRQAAAQAVFGAWSAESGPAGGPVVWEVDLELEQMAHQDLVLAGLSGTFRGVGAEITGSADLEGLGFSPLFWPSGRLVVGSESEGLALEIVLEDEEQEAWSSQIRLDLESRLFHLDSLSIAPNGGVWALERAVTLQQLPSGWLLEEVRLKAENGGAVSLQVDGQLARLHLQEFPMSALDSFTGTSGHSGTLTGSLERVESEGSLRLSGQLSGQKMVVPGWVQGLKFDLHLAPENQSERVALRLARGAKQLAEVDLLLPLSPDGWGLNWAAPMEGAIQLHPVDNRLLKKVLPALGELPRGFSAASLAIAGTPRNPRLEIESAVEWMLGAGPEFLRADMFLEQIGGALSGHGELRQAGRPLAEWKGQIQTGLPETMAWLAGEGAAPPIHLWDHWWQDGQIRVVSKGMAIDSIRPLLPFSLPVEGEVSGSLLMEGKPSSPWIHAGFSLTKGRLGEVDVPMAMLSLSPDADGYGIFAYGNLGEETLQIQGRVDLDLSGERLLREKLQEESLQLQVQGGVPLAVAGAWSDAIQNAQGALGLQGTIRGSLLRPTPDLRLQLKNGAMDWQPQALRLSAMSFGGRLTPSGLRIPRFSLKTQPAKASRGLELRTRESTISGSVVLPFDVSQPAELELIAKDAWLSSLDHQQLRVDGALSAEGPLSALRVEGKIKINEARLERTSADWLAEDALSLDPGILLHRKREVIAPQEKTPALWTNWRYALEIDLGSNTWIDAEVPLTESYGVIASRVSTIGLMGRLDGEVQLRKADGALGLQGEVDIQRGRSKVFGTDFDLESGRLLFSGASLTADRKSVV